MVTFTIILDKRRVRKDGTYPISFRIYQSAKAVTRPSKIYVQEHNWDDALLRFGSVGKRGPAKNAGDTELYLTALPTGSFGVELSQLETTDLFSSVDVSESIKQVITLIANTASTDEMFEAAIKNIPKRNLGNLKKFLYEIANENSILKVESSESHSRYQVKRSKRPMIEFLQPHWTGKNYL